MIFLSYTKKSKEDQLIADAIFLELNNLFPDQIFKDLNLDNNFWSFLEKTENNNNFFIFINSQNAQNDALFWKTLDLAWNFQNNGKIKKSIEIKIDGVQTPFFMKKKLVWIEYNSKIKRLIEKIKNGIIYDSWIEFKKESNFIYIKTYYKNDLNKKQAVLVNEKDEWDVIIVKIKSIHDQIGKWNYSIIADQPWMNNFYSSKPKVNPSEDNDILSQSWMKSENEFTKLIEPLDEMAISNENWQSFVFFKDVFEAYQIKKIWLILRDLINQINYTIEIL